MNDISQVLKSLVGQECKFCLGHHWGSLKGKVESFDGEWLKVKTKNSVKLVNAHQVVYIDVYNKL